MRSSSSRTRSGRLRAVTAWLVLVAVASTFAPTLASALWLPWASEQDKIAKVINEIFQALVANDLKMLQDYVVGTGSELFVMREKALIDRMKIKKYDCRPKSINIDLGTGSWAFVDLEKVATLENGETLTRRNMSVLRKVDGLWRLVVEPRKRDRRSSSDDSEPPAEEKARSSSADGAPAGPSVNGPSHSEQGVK